MALVTVGLVAACGGGARPSAPPRVAAPPVSRDGGVAALATEETSKEPAPFVGPVDPRLASIATPIEAAIREAKLPGCVVAIGRHDEVLHLQAFGDRALLPTRLPMTEATVFDLASLTKPLATATSIQILADRGKLDLDAPAARYLPELGRLPPFTVRQLLLHTSGLPAGTRMSDYLTDPAEVVRRLGELTMKHPPGQRFLYSDVGFVILGEIVRRASGMDLGLFSAAEIWNPLGMSETGFLPGEALRARAAPTEARDGVFMQGIVHDPRAYALGGVAGHAGVFSTAADLTRYARMMLGRGALDGVRILSDAAYESFVTPRDTSSGKRALGWDVASGFAASNKGEAFSTTAYGHGGFTGTGLWIDPVRDLFLVFLSNRVHPDGKGAVNPLIKELGTLAVQGTDVRTGIDVLVREDFARLRGARIGLVTNMGARTQAGLSTIDAFRRARGLTLATIFTPEHGLHAEREGSIGDSLYEGIPVKSLYGERGRPTSETLRGVDTLVFDLQDVGVRFYTYASTMKRVMKAAAEAGLRFVVLDRPNPLGGLSVEGPVLDPQRAGSFVNHHALPVRHGMTMGELARLFAEDEGTQPAPEIVRLENWRRQDYFDHTGLVWVRPSPNLRTVDAAVAYPMLGLVEGTNLSVGRGTDEPFGVVGAPWLDAALLKQALDAARLGGVRFEVTSFTPRAAPHAGRLCQGLRVVVTDRPRFFPVHAAVVFAVALARLHPDAWDVEHLDRLLQSEAAMGAITAGADAEEVEATWASELASFRARREAALLYP